LGPVVEATVAKRASLKREKREGKQGHKQRGDVSTFKRKKTHRHIQSAEEGTSYVTREESNLLSSN